MERELRFAVLTDTHIATPGHSDCLWWNRMLLSKSSEILKRAVCDINQLKPDFVVHCGDLTNAGDEESFRLAKELLDELQCPYYFVPGNHDTFLKSSREVMTKLFHLEPRRLYRSIETGNFLLILLDMAYWKLRDGSLSGWIDWQDWVGLALPPEELKWLEAELTKHRDKTVMIFAHHAPVHKACYSISRMPQGKPVENNPVDLTDYYRSSFINKEEFLAVIRRHRIVKAVFAGNRHCHEVNVKDGVMYCTTAALVSYPNEFRLVRATHDHIRVTAQPLSDPEFCQESYVEEWGNRWVWGTEPDRRYDFKF